MEAIVVPVLAARAALRTQYDALHRMVLELARRDPICQRLMTAPGVGPVVALTYRTVIDNPSALRQIEECRRPCRVDAADIPVRGSLANGARLTKRRRQSARSDVRGRPGPDDGTRQLILAQDLGHRHRAPAWHAEGDCRRRSVPGSDPAPHVGGRHRLPLRSGTRCGLSTTFKHQGRTEHRTSPPGRPTTAGTEGRRDRGNSCVRVVPNARLRWIRPLP